MPLQSIAYSIPLICTLLLLLAVLRCCRRKSRELSELHEKRYRALANDPRLYVTTEGWRCPWHPWQLVAGGTLLAENVIFYGFVAPTLWEPLWVNGSPASRILLYGHIFVAVVAAILLVWLEIHDPAAKTSPDKLPVPCQCRYCKQSYVGVHRKHCWSCNKCVAGFDHHCRYLNQCIGESNYHQWAVFVTCLFLTIATQLAATIFAVAGFFIKGEGSESDLDPKDTQLMDATLAADVWGSILWPCVVILGGVLQSVAVLFLCHLLYFHARTRIVQLWTGRFISTYTWWGKEYEEQRAFNLLERVLLLWLLHHADSRKAVARAFLGLVARFRLTRKMLDEEKRHVVALRHHSSWMGSVLYMSGASAREPPRYQTAWLEGERRRGTWPTRARPGDLEETASSPTRRHTAGGATFPRVTEAHRWGNSWIGTMSPKTTLPDDCDCRVWGAERLLGYTGDAPVGSSAAQAALGPPQNTEAPGLNIVEDAVVVEVLESPLSGPQQPPAVL